MGWTGNLRKNDVSEKLCRFLLLQVQRWRMNWWIWIEAFVIKVHRIYMQDLEFIMQDYRSDFFVNAYDTVKIKCFIVIDIMQSTILTIQTAFYFKKWSPVYSNIKKKSDTLFVAAAYWPFFRSSKRQWESFFCIFFRRLIFRYPG